MPCPLRVARLGRHCAQIQRDHELMDCRTVTGWQNICHALPDEPQQLLRQRRRADHRDNGTRETAPYIIYQCRQDICGVIENHHIGQTAHEIGHDKTRRLLNHSQCVRQIAKIKRRKAPRVRGDVGYLPGEIL